MSVYSGFTTRQMEHQYNLLTKTLLIILAKRVNKIYTDKPCNEEAFKKILLKVLCNMSLMERHKYMHPKYTENILSLVDIFSPTQLQNPTHQSQIQFTQKQQHHLPRNLPSQPLPRSFQQRQDLEYISDMPKQPTFQTPKNYQVPENFQTQIKQTQDQINNLQSNLNIILSSQQSNSVKESQRAQQQLQLNQDSSNYMKESSITSTKNAHNFSDNGNDYSNNKKLVDLKEEEVNLIENMLKQRKVEKISKKRRIKKSKKKGCTFEKLLMEFYDNDGQMNQIEEPNPFSLASRGHSNLNKQCKPIIRTRTHSLYK